MRISVASGKGGTGKTLVATSLAVSLKNQTRVQLLDCDVEAPNSHLFLNPAIAAVNAVHVAVPELDRQKCTYCGKCAEVCAFNAIAVADQMVLVFPELCHSCGACTYLCPAGALVETEREIGKLASGDAGNIAFVQGQLNIGEAMAVPVIHAVIECADNSALTIIDAPPGTSCPVIESVRGSDYCVLVTEPTPFGLHDLELALATIRELEIPCGVVLNRAGEGDELITEFCQREQIPLLLQIPLDIKIAESYSQGITLANASTQWRALFQAMVSQIGDQVGERTRYPLR